MTAAISIPRACSEQTARANVDCVSIEAYFRATVYIPFIDQLIQGLTERFGKTQQQVALASKLVPSVMVGSTPMTPAEKSPERGISRYAFSQQFFI